MSLAAVLNIHSKEGLINIGLLTDLVKRGIPLDDHVSRLYIWQIFLHCLPPDRSKWQEIIDLRESQYMIWSKDNFEGEPNWSDQVFPPGDQKYKNFNLKNNSVMAEIHGDIIRTPDTLFSAYGLGSCIEEIQHYMRRIERILYIFSIFNAAYTYTQGFHEIMIPIYHVALMGGKVLGFDEDTIESWAFALFQNLITVTGVGDLSTMNLDMNSITTRFKKIPEMTKIADQELYKYMFTSVKFVPMQFAYSWVSVLFQHLYIPDDLIVLWDRLFIKDTALIDFAMAIATAQLVEGRAIIIDTPFAEVMNFLHKMRDFDPSTILTIAEDIYSQYATFHFRD